MRFLDHRALSGVPRRKPTPKAVARARAGKRARTYLPALAVLDRGAEAIEPLLIESLTDAHTRAEHVTLADLLDALERRGHPLALHAHRGMLAGGPVTYVHPTIRCARARPASASATSCSTPNASPPTSTAPANAPGSSSAPGHGPRSETVRRGARKGHATAPVERQS